MPYSLEILWHRSTATTVEDDKVPFPEKIHYCKPPEKSHFANMSHRNIMTSSIINISLWNVCNWRGVMYMSSASTFDPPLMSLLFTSKNCKNIFTEWIAKIGKDNSKNEIGIRIIKGIDKNNPYWYRVVLGPLSFSDNSMKGPKIVSTPIRFMNMQPNSNENLLLFEQNLKIAKGFFICPSYIKE